MRDTVSGEVIGKRSVLFSLTLARIVTACTVLLQSRPLSLAYSAAFSLRSFVFGWAVLSLIGLLINWPKSQRDIHALIAVDLIFAGCITMLGAPVSAILVLLFGGIVLSASGQRWSPAIVVASFSAAVTILWAVEREFDLRWLELEVVPSDILVWILLIIGYAATLRLYIQRRMNLARLSGDIWIDPILSSNQPFSYDFTKWIDELAKLFEGRRSVSLLAFTQRGGAVRIFSNADFEPLRAELARELAASPPHLPDKLSIVRDLETSGEVAGDGSVKLLALFPLLDQSVVMARRFKMGRQNGMLIIAHDQPNDAVLEQEAQTIDHALDDVIERIGRTMELRRAFLSEAREVARRDLHDGVLQSLAALRMKLLTIIQTHAVNDQISAEIRSTAEIIALEQARLRSLLDESVDAEQPVNLIEALRICVRTTALQWEIDIEFASSDLAIPMHRESVNNIEYLLREVIANATRHSKSKNLRCSLALRDDNLIISMMDLSQTAATLQSYGDPLASQSLRQRLALVNGRAYSEGLPGGTLLAVAIPVVYDEVDL